jgi:MFS family permease
MAPQIKAQIGASDAVFGAVLVGTAIGLFATVLLAPRYDAALGRLSLPVACAMLSLTFFLPGHAGSALPLFFVMILLGMCSGLLDVIVNARVSELEMIHRRPFMNANHGMFSLFYATGAILTGLAREAGASPALIFTLFAIAGLMLASQCFAPVSAPPADDGNPTAPLSWRILGLCGCIVLIAFTAEASVEAWSALHIARTLGGRAA